MSCKICGSERREAREITKGRAIKFDNRELEGLLWKLIIGNITLPRKLINEHQRGQWKCKRAPRFFKWKARSRVINFVGTDQAKSHGAKSWPALKPHWPYRNGERERFLGKKNTHCIWHYDVMWRRSFQALFELVSEAILSFAFPSQSLLFILNKQINKFRLNNALRDEFIFSSDFLCSVSMKWCVDDLRASIIYICVTPH